MKKYLKPIAGFLAIAFFATSCRKEPITPPDSSKELKIVGWDSLSKYGGYISCGTAGMVDADGISYNFVAPSQNGAVTITYMKFHVNVNDGSKPLTMFSLWDNNAITRDVMVTGSDVEFKDLKTVIPEGDNGRWVGINLTYSGIGRNGVVSGKTISSITLLEVRYTDQGGLKKTIHPNLKNADKMSVYSYVRLNGNYPQYTNSLTTGMNRIYNQGFASEGGDNLIETLSLKMKSIGCAIGATPHVSIMMWEYSAQFPGPVTPVQVTMANDSTAVLTLPKPYLLQKDHTIFIDFYTEVQSFVTAPSTVLRASIGNLKYFKYKEMATGIEFSSSNEFYMWPYWSNQYQYANADYNWELRP